MNEILKCSRCGAEIPSGSTGGVCPRCAAGFLRATQTEMSEDAASKRDFNPPSVAELRPLFPQLEIAIEKGSAPSQSKAASGADTPPSNAIDAKNSKDGPAWLKAFLAGALVLFVVVCSLSVVLVTTLRGFVLTLATAGALGLAILLFVRKLSWGRGFVAAFLLVFLVVFGFGAFVTAVLPDSFVSTA